MYFSALLAGFFAGLTPFWGLLIMIAYGYGRFQAASLRYLLSFALAAAVSAVLVNGTDLPLPLLDAILGVGLMAVLVSKALQKERSTGKALLQGAGFALAYGILRHLVFGNILQKQLEISRQASEELTQTMFAANPELLQIAEQSMQSGINFLTTYGSLIWYLVMVTALFLGILWLSMREKLSESAAELTLPYWLVYPLIAAMLAFLSSPLRVAGISMLLVLLPLFLFQGVALSMYFFRNIVHSRYTFWLLVMLAVFLSYLYLIFMVMMGIADMWLQLRTSHRQKIKTMLDEKK